MTTRNDYERLMKQRPHVVILGAGASCATIPHGDKNGRVISAMSGFLNKLGLEDLLSEITLITTSDNLEDIYMELEERSVTEPQCKIVKLKIEEIVREYMEQYKLPDNPTVYDFLILSLTRKDMIATFNWDPLLLQAYVRVKQITNNLPNLAFLHGNVAVGYCEEDNIWGNVGYPCRCGKPFKPMNLLYPIKNKDYITDIAIRKSWKILSNALEKAYMITIFGYSAPKSDVEAIELMQKAWGHNSEREFEEIEIIDIMDEEKAVDSWSDFIHTHHYSYHTNFFNTTLGKFPRRSCEVTFDRTMNINFQRSHGFQPDMDFNDIESHLSELLNDENIKSGTLEMLRNPYNI